MIDKDITEMYDDELVEYLGHQLDEIKALTANIPLDRLEEICNAERDGRLVVLPCKVGTPVFAIVTHCQDCVDSGLDDCNDYDDNTCMYESKYTIIETVFLMRMVDSFGKTVFPTKAEAEKHWKWRGWNEILRMW